jgi:hypothetical protein
VDAGEPSGVVGDRGDQRREGAPRRLIRIAVVAMRMEPQRANVDGRGIEAARGEVDFGERAEN